MSIGESKLIFFLAFMFLPCINYKKGGKYG